MTEEEEEEHEKEGWLVGCVSFGPLFTAGMLFLTSLQSDPPPPPPPITCHVDGRPVLRPSGLVVRFFFHDDSMVISWVFRYRFIIAPVIFSAPEAFAPPPPDRPEAERGRAGLGWAGPGVAWRSIAIRCLRKKARQGCG